MGAKRHWKALLEIWNGRGYVTGGGWRDFVIHRYAIRTKIYTMAMTVKMTKTTTAFAIVMSVLMYVPFDRRIWPICLHFAVQFIKCYCFVKLMYVCGYRATSICAEAIPMNASTRTAVDHRIPGSRCWLAFAPWPKRPNPNRWRRYWRDFVNSTTSIWSSLKRRSFWR